MIYLFIHQNFPGQYQHLVRHLANKAGNKVYFLTQPNASQMPGITKVVYGKVTALSAGCHPLTLDVDRAVRTGVAAADACRQLREQGVYPDIVVGHSGWGETLFIKDVFPRAVVLAYFEFFYHPRGVDTDFDPEFNLLFNEPARLRVRNAINWLAFDSADWGHTPTNWQRGLHPPEMRGRLTTIHEGIDTALIRPDPSASVALARERVTLSRKDEVVTYAARSLEPYRGFHIFMRALPEILRRRPRAHVVIVGGDEVSYGSPAPPGVNFREVMLREVGDALDLDRVHFVGRIERAVYLKLLQVSSVHIYLTYPFVLSWSFLEAMACGSVVIGSATPPVLEVLRDGVNGLAVDFFSSRAIADRVDEVLDHPDRLQHIGRAARETVTSGFDLHRRQLPLWERVLDDLAGGRSPLLDLAPGPGDRSPS